jgi:hypothetical protein
MNLDVEIVNDRLQITLLDYDEQGDFIVAEGGIYLVDLKAALESVGSFEPENKGSGSS